MMNAELVLVMEHVYPMEGMEAAHTDEPLFGFVTDPSVSRYHVQWVPEYCSHNETRGPEKSVTQVGFRPKNQRKRSTRAVQITGCCLECYESVIRTRHVECWPIKDIHLNNASQNREFIHLQWPQPCCCRRLCFGMQENLRLDAWKPAHS